MTREAFIAQYAESGENFKVMPLADGLLYYAEPWTDACFEGPDPTCPSPASSPIQSRRMPATEVTRRFGDL